MKKGQAAMNANGSAILIIVVTALIVLYILFLPPADRAELLGESTGGSGVSGSGGTTYNAPVMTLFSENIGRIDYLNSDEREHFLPSFRIGTKVDGTVIQSVNSVYVKSSSFDSIIENVSFKIDTELTQDLKLSFNIGKVANGRLIVLLNNRQIMNDEFPASSSQFVTIPADQLQRYNVLTIGVSSPGWAFWTAHEYQLQDVQITGDVTDLSGASSRQSFILDDKEVEYLDRAVLKFYADCEPRNAGRMHIKINGRTVYSSYADCGIMNTIELDKYLLDWGENEVVFSTESGDYLITNVEVKTTLEEPVYPIYYFEFDDAYFINANDDEEICGVVDGVCPSGCSDDADKDCCFDNGDNYWCDVETAQFNDRCVSFVTASTCDRCESGYEDDNRRAPEACEGLCGDDRDGDCPVGCSPYADKDCCFEAGNNYWCDDVPLGKPLSATCKAGVEPDERNSCPNKYYNEDGNTLAHTTSGTDDDYDDLKNGYKAMIEIAYPNGELKTGQLLINGRNVGLDTRRVDWEMDISDYVRPGTNSIQIVPARSVDITSMKVAVERD